MEIELSDWKEKTVAGSYENGEKFREKVKYRSARINEVYTLGCKSEQEKQSMFMQWEG